MSDFIIPAKLDLQQERPTQAGMTGQVVRASLWGLGGQGVMLLASLISTPFVIRLLGPESYGVLALINLLITYIAFADVGMGVASTRFAADACARGNDRDEVAIIWTALGLAALPIVVGAVALVITAGPIVSQLLRLPADIQPAAVVAVRLAAVAFAARGIAGILNTPLLVRLRLDINTMIVAGGAAGQNLLIPLVLVLGGGLISATAVIAVVSIISLVVYIIVSQRFLPGLLAPKFKRDALSPLIRFGGATITSTLAGLILLSAEKFLLTRFASVKVLAYYTVAGSLVGLAAVVPGALSQPLLPAFSRLQAEPDRAPLQQLYARALRGNLLWITPAIIVLFVAAKPFFTAWAGPEFGRESTVPFYILSVGLVFNAMTYVPCNLLMALHRTNEVARIRMTQVLPYLLVAGALTYKFGILGAAVSWSLRLIVDALLLFAAARRVSTFTFSPFSTKRFHFLLAVVSLVIPIALTLAFNASLMAILGLTFLSLAAYGVIVWMVVLSPEERAWIDASFRRQLRWVELR